eukprot:498076_1
MSYFPAGTIAGLSIAACCVPCIFYAVCCAPGLFYFLFLFGNNMRFGLKTQKKWECYCCPMFHDCQIWLHYSIQICMIFCIGIIGFTTFLLFIFESSNIHTASLNFIYCLIFLIIPIGCALLSFIFYCAAIDWHDYEMEQQQKLNTQINRQLTKDRREQKYNQYDLLLMSNNTETAQLFFDKMCVLNDFNTFYQHLILKYVIKNLQSLIIITSTKNKSCLKILSFPTYGISFQHYGKGLNNLYIKDKIINVWNSKSIQSTVQMLSQHTETTRNNIVHVQFLNHFLNNKDIKNLELDDSDITILLREHEFYQNKLYFGNDEFQIITPTLDTYDINTYDPLETYTNNPIKINIRIHESQQKIDNHIPAHIPQYDSYRCNEKLNEKWIDLFLGRKRNTVIYIFDLNVFKYSTYNIFGPFLRYCSAKYFKDYHYIPNDVANLIHEYLPNENRYLWKHFNRISILSKRYNSKTFMVVFVNCNIFGPEFNIYSVPQHDHEYFEMNKNEYDAALDKIKDLCLHYYAFMNTLENNDEFKNIVSQIFAFIRNRVPKKRDKERYYTKEAESMV